MISYVYSFERYITTQLFLAGTLKAVIISNT